MTVAVAAGSFKAWGTMKISTVCVMTMATSWPLRAMAMVMGIAFWHRIISTRLTQAISIRRACACCKKMRVDINLLHLIITYYKNIRILDAIICWLSLLTFGLTKTATIAKQTDFFGGGKKIIVLPLWQWHWPLLQVAVRSEKQWLLQSVSRVHEVSRSQWHCLCELHFDTYPLLQECLEQSASWEHVAAV